MSIKIVLKSKYKIIEPSPPPTNETAAHKAASGLFSVFSLYYICVSVCLYVTFFEIHICVCMLVHWTKPPACKAGGSFFFTVGVCGYPLIKRPIMDGFQSKSCLWKCLDKMLQSTMSSNSWTALTAVTAYIGYPTAAKL